MPKHPFYEARGLRAGADRHGRVMEEVVAKLFEMAKGRAAELDEQRAQRADRLRLRAAWTPRRPFKRPRRKPGDEPESGGVPAVPDRPKNLSGGAAAALEFETD